jgi:hypothetical protein
MQSEIVTPFGTSWRVLFEFLKKANFVSSPGWWNEKSEFGGAWHGSKNYGDHGYI